MVVEQSNIDHIMRGLQSTEGVRLHNHRKKLRQRFDIIKKLGQGTYGKVQLGINKETGQEVAIKTIKKCKIETEADLVRIRREIQIMSSVRHPNIIHIYEVFENREKMVLVMEYAAGGELYDFLSERKVLEEVEARRIFRQISTAIYYCHKHKICHRDLKLENILLDEHGSAKIADFGLSNVFDEQRLLSTFCGSPLYASPEIVKGTPYHGPEVDCWSLGVLLYTLVYGAMPFDGSNFKRLVKQISQGDYFEPKKPSPASPLVREMLTVNPAKRATIEQICSHWWVNEGFNVSCLDIAEDLANQTPVRLDLLLTLAPPPENSDKLVVTDEPGQAAQDAPPRSHSVGSFMELDPNTEQRIRDFVAQEVPSTDATTTKRKLETGPSETSVSKGGARKKERTKPSDKSKTTEPNESKLKEGMEVDTKGQEKTEDVKESANVEVAEPAKSVPTETKEPETPVSLEEKPAETIVKEKPTRRSVKVKKASKDSESEKKDEEGVTEGKVKVKKKKKSESPAPEQPDEGKKELKKDEKEKEEVGKEIKREGSTRKSRGNLKLSINQEKEKSTTPNTPEEGPSKPMERRKSKVFEAAEKFMTSEPKSPVPEKPKKVVIPGVKVSDFAKAFERRTSVTPSTTPLKSSPSKKLVKKPSMERETEPSPTKSEESEKSSQAKELSPEGQGSPDKDKDTDEIKMTKIDDDKLKKMKDSARNVITNALVEEERKKIKKQILKPPVPKVKSEDSSEPRKKPLTLQIGNETATVELHSPENAKSIVADTTEGKENKENVKEKKSAKVEITLKSNTLPRRTSKAEIQLTSPPSRPPSQGSFRTEVEHRVGDPVAYTTQRSEVAFPVSAAQKPARAMSLEPEGARRQQQQRERIIPIQLDDGAQEARDRVRELERPPSQSDGRRPYQRTLSQRSASLSRQSTQDSDTESVVSTGEPIRKSAREFIIPIAVEGGGYVTPRATSLEPSDSVSSKRSIRPISRKISMWSDNGSEDEGPFSAHEPMRLHRLVSSRPSRMRAERADSASGSASEEEEEDDDGFELLTAENLFSTLLSRVRSLTQRLNVEDTMRPGFPTQSRLMMNHFPNSQRLLSMHEPLTRLADKPDFGRGFGRNAESMMNRWNRGYDLSDSESSRSVHRRQSKCRPSDSDTDCVSESSTLPRRHRPEERRGRRSHSHSRTRSVIESELAMPDSHQLQYRRQCSEGVLDTPLHRAGSLRSERKPRRPERKSLGSFDTQPIEESVEKDFYDILAEKYGITNVKRYDLDRRKSPTPPDNAKRRSSSKEVVGRRDDEIAGKVLPPLPPKPKKDESASPDKEKLKTPSEKLAAVLNKLETNYEKEKEKKKEDARGVPNELLYGRKESKIPTPKARAKEPELRRVESERLADLSPKALELYEKTLGLYQKSLNNQKKAAAHVAEQKSLADKTVKAPTATPVPLPIPIPIPIPAPQPQLLPVTLRTGIPQKIITRHMSDMSLKDLEKYSDPRTRLRHDPRRPEVPGYPMLGRYQHYGSMENGLPNHVLDKSYVDQWLKNYSQPLRPDIEPTEKKKSEKKQSKTEDESKKEESPDKKKLTRRPSKEGDEGKKKIVKVKRLSKNEDEVASKPETPSEDVWKRQESQSGEPKGRTHQVQAVQQSPKHSPAPSTPEAESPKPGPKSKFLSNLEKKFEKLRGTPEKKYIDKAIRSLRESSQGPTESMPSESMLIKRAVSLSDCSIAKPVPPSMIQSTVNSVLGMFKKMEQPEPRKVLAPVADRRDSMPALKCAPVETKPLTPVPRIEVPSFERPAPSQPTSSSRRPSWNTTLISSPSAMGLDDSSSFLSPDSESFDSWSNCSDTPDEFLPPLKSISPVHRMASQDEPGSESVGDRIRRKSFYSRFNERKPRKSAILEGKKKYDQEMYEQNRSSSFDHQQQQQQQPYVRTSTQSLDKPRVQQPYLRSVTSADYSKPKPFYKVGSKSPTNESPTYRKLSLDWSKAMTNSSFVRSNSQTSTNSTLNPDMTRSYLGSYDNFRSRRCESVYSPKPTDLQRPFSPIRTFSPSRTFSPTFGLRVSPGTSALD